MELKIMMIIALAIMGVRLVRSADRGTLGELVGNIVVIFTLLLR